VTADKFIQLDPVQDFLIERRDLVMFDSPIRESQVTFTAQPEHRGRFVLRFRVWTTIDAVSGVGAPPRPSLDSVVVVVNYSWLRIYVTALLAGLFVATVLLLGRFIRTERVEQRLRITEAKRKIEQAEINADKAPEKAKFAWDLARVKLEAYFDRNLAQVNQVFWLAVTVMIVGFAFVLWGVIVQLAQPRISPTALVAGISGIITQFIGATFLVIYRSTMVQANEFMLILERINTVGMAVQVLDSIPESLPDLKSSSRAEIITLLLSANIGRTVPRPKSGKPK
jgi:hypothetical protein